MCQKRKSNSSSSFICLTNIKSENSNYKMQPNAVSFEGHEWAAVIIITISLSINHNGYVIGIDGPLLKMMTLNPRQLINTEKNWLSGNSWSWFVVAWKPVLPQNVKDRWFPCWNLTSPLGHLLPPVTPRHAHRSALTNQRRGGLQRFFAPSDVRRATSRLWDTFNHQRGGLWLCCCCWWRPGRRDRGTSCLTVIMKAFWRRGPSKIRYVSQCLAQIFFLSKHQEMCQQTAQYESLGHRIDTRL